ncbi:MAG: flippase [Candidatus Staskawiczbacteria bacterium]|nr:flippase [Candidatus Staskawiczbacteria bacterium]
MPAYIKNFLFQNIGIRQTVFKNTFWLALAEVVARILGLVLVIYIVRALGAQEYGKFVFALSFASVLSILSDLGIMDISTREFSRDRNNERNFNSIFTLELLLCAATLIISVIASFFIVSDPSIRKIIWILTIFVLSNSLFAMVFSLVRARQKMEYEAIIKITQAVANAMVVFAVIFFMPSAQNVGYGYMVSNAAVLLFLLVFFGVFVQPLKFKWEKSSLNILRISWPLSFGFMASWIYMSINSIMLGSFNLITENGWYGAAFKIAIVAVIPANLIMRSFYPLLSNFFVSSHEKLQKAWDYFAESMLLLTIPIVVGGYVLAPKIIWSFYGADFAPSVIALQLLMLVIGVSFLNYPYTIMLVAAEQQKKNFLIMAFGAVVNVILNLVFIPKYGFSGAIIATLISCILVFFSTIVIFKYTTPIVILNRRLMKVFFISIVSSGIMYYVITSHFIYSLNVIVACLAGALAYGCAILVMYKVILGSDLLKVEAQ